MLKFFRKIRQKLLSEKKFTKYLVYAAGEIVLVVIGILIALQINNWNNARIQQNEAEELKANLLEELYGVEGLIRGNISALDDMTAAYMYVFQNPDFKIDSLQTFAVKGRWNIYPVNYLFNHIIYFNPRDDIYQSAINDGSITLIKSKETVAKLNTAYNVSAKRLSDLIEQEVLLNKSIRDHLASEYSELYDHAFVQHEYTFWDENLTRQTIELIRNDGELKFLITSKIYLLRSKEGVLGTFVRNDINEAIENLEAE